MELRDLKTFAVVAKLLSFHRAGQELGAAQSTVSVRIQALEEELGVRLFDRLGRGVALTEAGVRLLEYARKMGEIEQEAKTDVGGARLAAGSLTVRVPESLSAHSMPAVAAEFGRRFPRVRLRLTACTREGLAADLRKGITDLAFLLGAGVTLKDLQVECLGVAPLSLVAMAGHPLAARAVVAPGDLEGARFVLSTADCSTRRVLDEVLAEHGVTTHVVTECASEASLVRLAGACDALAVLSQEAARSWESAGLVALPFAEPLEAGVLMITLKDKWISPAQQTFMDLARRLLTSQA